MGRKNKFQVTFYHHDQLLQLLLVAVRMSNTVITENKPVRRIGIEWHQIINTPFTLFLPDLIFWMSTWVLRGLLNPPLTSCELTIGFIKIFSVDFHHKGHES